YTATKLDPSASKQVRRTPISSVLPTNIAFPLTITGYKYTQNYRNSLASGLMGALGADSWLYVA
ncbi:MAG: hypothetical protein LBG11_03090, partial [Bifidobacteriaceae bacterium]|nr:hypothetical protein [Bifidobacteriaceae bacterium]